MYSENQNQNQLQQQPIRNSIHDSIPHSLRHQTTTSATATAITPHPIMHPQKSATPSPKATASANSSLPRLQTSGFSNYTHERRHPESASTTTPSSSTRLHPSSSTLSSTAQSSPSRTSPILNSDNKICQWYCCSCGQSYGSVLYKDDSNKKDGFTEHPQMANNHRTEASPTASTRNYIFDSLKYYSQVVYRDHKHALSNSPTLMKADNYFEYKERQSNGEYNHYAHHTREHAQQHAQEHSLESDVIDTPESPRLNPHTPLISPLHLDLNSSSHSLIEYQDRAILSIPSRFTCHRCNHMMCPYCLKLRLKDI
ncbi:hypothetical protein KGF57_000127 [Candida theae]|uniref:Uncharacterized protein n=1 Tax=Candida theae TaxID=1198502 RepID=A0AAD5G181_9ASCO|nr:uncharacterized protein KGF57_000127 [Candida theae]KAI5968433.1 hypothetical protein KGF57_000127 [Candida theae]